MTDGTKSSPVKIDDDVWLGMNVIVLKGVHIGKGVVVAANSVVATSLPDHVLAGGSPAKIIRKLS
ncbi:MULTISPECIES: DapH/DapD/GlmU-related protein [Cupriavidus]